MSLFEMKWRKGLLSFASDGKSGREWNTLTMHMITALRLQNVDPTAWTRLCSNALQCILRQLQFICFDFVAVTAVAVRVPGTMTLCAVMVCTIWTSGIQLVMSFAQAVLHRKHLSASGGETSVKRWVCGQEVFKDALFITSIYVLVLKQLSHLAVKIKRKE